MGGQPASGGRHRRPVDGDPLCRRGHAPPDGPRDRPIRASPDGPRRVVRGSARRGGGGFGRLGDGSEQRDGGALDFRLASESFVPVGKWSAKDDRGMPGQRVTRAGLGGDRGSVAAHSAHGTGSAAEGRPKGPNDPGCALGW